MCNDIQNMISLTDSVFNNLFNLIYNPNIHYEYNNISIYHNKKNLNESFLQKKRNLQTYTLFNYSNKIFENQSFIDNLFELNKTDNQQINYIQDNINKKLNENKINEFINGFKTNDNTQFNNISDSNIINIDSSLNYNIKNLNKNKNNLNNFPKNNNIIESDIVNINKQIKEICKTNKFYITKDINNHKIHKKKIFFKKHENNHFSKFQNKNNELKVFKNKKLVYINKSLLNYNSSKDLKKFKKISFIRKAKRSSKYRGVSKNGNQWQVLFMNDTNKSYIKSYSSEEVAARIYDILEIKKRGIKAKTNFKYNNLEMEQIKEMDIDIKSKNIEELICSLFKQ